MDDLLESMEKIKLRLRESRRKGPVNFWILFFLNSTFEWATLIFLGAVIAHMFLLKYMPDAGVTKCTNISVLLILWSLAMVGAAVYEGYRIYRSKSNQP